MIEDETKETLTRHPLFTVVQIPVELLAQAEYNPRKFRSDESKEALKKSMAANPDFLKARPIIVNMHDGREGIIIAGHKRFIAAAELGWNEVSVMLVNVDPIKEKAWNIMDNVHQGEWDLERRKELVTEIRDAGYDMGSIGYTGGEIVDLMGGLTLATDKENDPDYHGTTPKKKPKVKLAEGMELECPNCHTKFSYSVKMETAGEEEATIL